MVSAAAPRLNLLRTEDGESQREASQALGVAIHLAIFGIRLLGLLQIEPVCDSVREGLGYCG